MLAYIVRRLLLIIPTLLGIMALNFAIVQAAPGGPIEQIIARLRGADVSATARFSGGTAGDMAATAAAKNAAELSADASSSRYPGAAGIDPELIRQLERQFGFDEPLWKRFVKMLGNYARFDFGTSYFRDQSVMGIIASKLPVSVSLGLWTTLIVYLVSIPLGIRKAVRDGTPFDAASSLVIIILSAIPGYLFANLLIVVFCGGHYVQWFPLRGIVSDNWSSLDWPHRILDYFWHIALPILAMAIGGFASLTMLVKNSFLDEINKQYVLVARSKGLSERGVLYGHVFRNAMLIVIAGFPAAFVSIFFTGSFLIEIIFSLDGIGLLGFESVVNRDYPVVLATVYIYSLIGLVTNLVSDLTYAVTDPRIDFEARET